jgi:hypothetical protein
MIHLLADLFSNTLAPAVVGASMRVFDILSSSLVFTFFEHN